jgi:Na+/melibiose symporter-like transporter
MGGAMYTTRRMIVQVVGSLVLMIYFSMLITVYGMGGQMPYGYVALPLLVIGECAAIFAWGVLAYRWHNWSRVK